MIHRRRLCIVMLASLAAPTAGLAAESSGKKKGGGVTYLQLDTLTATVVHGDGRRGVLTVDIGLDIPDTGLRARADLSKPRLRAAYIQRLQIYATGLAPDAPPDPDYLSRVLQQETDQALGRPGAKVLLGAILVN
jgi:hypothetical protein